MPLTPADVHNITFQKAAMGKRGYDADEVDALREEISQEMIRLMEEREALEAQVRRGSEPDPADELAAVSGELNQALRERERAEREADGLHRRLEEVRHTQAPPTPAAGDDRVLALAQRTADDHVRDAVEESEHLVIDARERSERMVSEAVSNASDIEQEALRRDDEATRQIAERRSALQHEIAELTEFAQNYREGLADDVRHQGDL